MEEIVKECGFESFKEFNHLVSNVDLSTPEKIKTFEDWKLNDGTKAGLLSLSE